MDAEGQDGQEQRYKTGYRVQAWFLGRSRDKWKRKYKEKADAKRLENRVHDVNRSRESWREKAERLEAENAAWWEQAALKKDGRGVLRAAGAAGAAV